MLFVLILILQFTFKI